MPRKTRFEPRRSRRTASVEKCELEDIMVQTPRVLSDRATDVFAAAVFEVAAHPGRYKDIAEEKEDDEEVLI